MGLFPMWFKQGKIKGTEVWETWLFRETENNFDVIYCEWEKCNQTLKEITPKEDKSNHKKRKHE